jgi:hypothetical protein
MWRSAFRIARVGTQWSIAPYIPGLRMVPRVSIACINDQVGEADNSQLDPATQDLNVSARDVVPWTAASIAMVAVEPASSSSGTGRGVQLVSATTSADKRRGGWLQSRRRFRGMA